MVPSEHMGASEVGVAGKDAGEAAIPDNVAAKAMGVDGVVGVAGGVEIGAANARVAGVPVNYSSWRAG